MLRPSGGEKSKAAVSPSLPRYPEDFTRKSPRIEDDQSPLRVKELPIHSAHWAIEGIGIYSRVAAKSDIMPLVQSAADLHRISQVRLNGVGRSVLTSATLALRLPHTSKEALTEEVNGKNGTKGMMSDLAASRTINHPSE